MIKWLLGTAPDVGSYWRFRDESPFQVEPMVIVGVKKGWVQYKRTNWGKGISPMDAPIRAFRMMYKEM